MGRERTLDSAFEIVIGLGRRGSLMVEIGDLKKLLSSRNGWFSF